MVYPTTLFRERRIELDRINEIRLEAVPERLAAQGVSLRLALYRTVRTEHGIAKAPTNNAFYIPQRNLDELIRHLTEVRDALRAVEPGE